MSRMALLVATAILAAAATLASARATVRPTLRLVDASPIAFRGAGFEAHERVRVSVYAGARATKRVVAGAHGGFVVRFSSLEPDACAGLSALAIGSKGSRASFRLSPGMCPAP